MTVSAMPNADSVFFLLPESLRNSLTSQGILTPTPIQQSAYKPVVEGHDVIAQSRTGSGKTLAFGLPAIARLKTSQQGMPRMLVLTPTRELAAQIASVFETNFRPLGFRILAITGGKSYRFQSSQLQRGIDIVVGTPGRLTDLLNQNILDLSKTEILVLDEMDEMLDFGFADDLLKIKSAIGKKAQTLLFSATFPPKVAAIARQMVQNPVEIKVPTTDTSTGQIEHSYVEVRPGKNLDALINLLLFNDPEHGIIFCKTREETRTIHNALLERGFKAGVLNGEMTQNDRSQTMDRFRAKHIRLLVATDVAARGIDISGLSHVINFSVPMNLETYTHRVGRTGRAGATGQAWTIVAPMERREYQFICSRLKINPKALEIASAAKITTQFIDNFLFRATEQNVQAKEFIKTPVQKFVDELSPEKAKEILSAILKAEATRFLGKGLYVEDIVPSFGKSSFGVDFESQHRSSSYGGGGNAPRRNNERGGRFGGGGYGNNGGGRGGRDSSSRFSGGGRKEFFEKRSSSSSAAAGNAGDRKGNSAPRRPESRRQFQ